MAAVQRQDLLAWEVENQGEDVSRISGQVDEPREAEREEPSWEAKVQREAVSEEVRPREVPATRRLDRREGFPRRDVDVTDAELLRTSPALKGKYNLNIYSKEDTDDLFGEGDENDDNDDDGGDNHNEVSLEFQADPSKKRKR